MSSTKSRKEIITDKRKNQTLKGLIQETVIEAEQLGVSEEELINMLQTMIRDRKGDAK